MKPVRSFLLTAILAMAAQAHAAGLININMANASELAEGLHGVGLSKANAIVDYRVTHGRFTVIDDLVLVKGIGERIVDKNRDRLSVGQQH